MRVLNGTAAPFGAHGTCAPRCTRTRAFFGRDRTPTPRRPSGDADRKRTGFQAARDGLLSSAPQVRVRQANDRAKQQLGELALLNETLLGKDSWRIRQKVEYLKSKRKAWEGVYHAACRQEVSLTVAHLESAMAEVRTKHIIHHNVYFSCICYCLRAVQYVVLRCHQFRSNLILFQN
jgi:hypothetical protein